MTIVQDHLTRQNQFISENVWTLDRFTKASLFIHPGGVCEMTGGGEADWGAELVQELKVGRL